MSIRFEGVMPAITTPFAADLSVDHEALSQTVQWLAGHGCSGIVPCGSLGEGATLEFDEKVALIETAPAPSTSPSSPASPPSPPTRPSSWPRPQPTMAPRV